MAMMDALIVIVMVIWMVLLMLYRMAQERLKNMALRQHLSQELEKRKPVGMSVEEIDGVLYGWDCQSNDFVCQGRDLAELRTNFRARYPDRNAAIVAGSDELVQRLRQDLKKLSQNENFNSQ